MQTALIYLHCSKTIVLVAFRIAATKRLTKAIRGRKSLFGSQCIMGGMSWQQAWEAAGHIGAVHRQSGNGEVQAQPASPFL